MFSLFKKEQNRRQTNGRYKDEGDWGIRRMKRKGRKKEHKKTKQKKKREKETQDN